MVKRLLTGILCNKNREVINVGKPMILLSSVTYAMKSRDILFRYGIRAYVERTPRSNINAGCGYSIYVPERTDEAERILASNGIRIIGRAERIGNA